MTYQKENLRAVLNMQDQLLKLVLREGEDVDKHFESFANMFAQLASLGSPIAGQEKLGNFTRSMPELSDISSVARNLNLTYDPVRSSVKSEIDHKESTSGSKPNTTATLNFGARSVRKKNREVECLYCHKSGPFDLTCRKKQRDRKRGF